MMDLTEVETENRMPDVDGPFDNADVDKEVSDLGVPGHPDLMVVADSLILEVTCGSIFKMCDHPDQNYLIFSIITDIFIISISSDPKVKL